jgi:uncharacterized repeat protein (TIGR01451 family)
LRAYWVLSVILTLGLFALLAGIVSSSAMAPVEAAAGIAVQRNIAMSIMPAELGATGPIIIDHTCTDLSQVPDYWIDQAKALLRVSYGHTSHGSQPITGMSVLMANTPSGLYNFNTNGAVAAGVLSIDDRVPDGDLGNPDRVTWEARTRTYLNDGGSDRNVVVWSWCGQVSSATEANIETYLNLMNGLEKDYPNVTFIYMTGHLDGGGVGGNLNVRNEQIRQYCQNNNKILFDFADIESYDPDGDEFLSKYATDGCYYSCGSGTCNWADQWCTAHGSDPLCDSCSCAHSKPLNCNLKARAFWWMLARIAGWAGPGEETSQKSSTTSVAYQGDVFTYTIEVSGLDAPPATTIYLTDVVPAGVEYISDTLDATSGVVDDDHDPTLLWSGVLDPAPVVMVTYAVSVTESGPQAVKNTATLDAPGHDTAEHSATVLLNPLALYFPLGARNQ